MKKRIYIRAFTLLSLLVFCRVHPALAQAEIMGDAIAEYHTDQLIIRRLSPHVYQHVSYFDSQDFGRVDCNGMIVINNGQAIVFDTPSGNDGAEELIDHLTNTHRIEIIAVVPTHFHEDCLGGIEKFHTQNIPSYASKRTIALLDKKGKRFSKAMNGFDDSLRLDLGSMPVDIQYFGEGHTRDNVVVYVADDQVVFGGCLIKAVGAGKGNLEDANEAAWPETVRRLKQAYPKTTVVIPGHGETGGLELLDYTIDLFD